VGSTVAAQQHHRARERAVAKAHRTRPRPAKLPPASRSDEHAPQPANVHSRRARRRRAEGVATEPHGTASSTSVRLASRPREPAPGGAEREFGPER
jgi:hypothetical protein